MRLEFLLLVCLAVFADCLKFLAYNPRIGTSHYTFISRIVEALVEAGHDVVMLAPEVTDKVKIPDTKGARIIKDLPIDSEALALSDKALVNSSDLYWSYSSDFDFIEIMNTLNLAASKQCNATINAPGLLEKLRAEKFDAAFAEPIDLCGFGIFGLLGIDNYAMTLSISSTDASFEVTGVPTTTSYLPGSMADFSDKMTFRQRVENTLALGAVYYYIHSTRELFQPIFEHVQPGFPQLKDIITNSSLMFSNTDPLVDFPRLTSHKIVDIGGITTLQEEQPLDEKWSAYLALRPSTVLLSFGSAAQANRMPDDYKRAIKEMVKALPQVTFIVKYEKPEHNFSGGLENMIESTWVPQRSLLKDGRLSAFITHGGMGSTNEATAAGVPLIVIPLMGDQLRNARVIERLTTGIRVPKSDLSHPAKLIEAVSTILADPSYKRNSALIAAQLRDQPFSPKEKLVQNMEFMAKYGPLKMLDHYGPKMSILQYYLVDVFAFIGAVLIAALASILLCLRFTLRFVYRKTTSNTNFLKDSKQE